MASASSQEEQGPELPSFRKQLEKQTKHIKRLFSDVRQSEAWDGDPWEKGNVMELPWCVHLGNINPRPQEL